MRQLGGRRIEGEGTPLSSGVLGRALLIEIIEDNRILIENHSGITYYGENEIYIKTRNGPVKISGNQLQIMFMSKEKIIITGVIASVDLWGDRNC